MRSPQDGNMAACCVICELPSTDDSLTSPTYRKRRSSLEAPSFSPVDHLEDTRQGTQDTRIIWGTYQLFTLATNEAGISLAGGRTGNASAAIASMVSVIVAEDILRRGVKRSSLAAMVTESSARGGGGREDDGGWDARRDEPSWL